jgi:SHS2 domain-containing protein
MRAGASVGIAVPVPDDATHTWAEHVGELELHLFADDEAGIFASAVAALGELLSGEEDGEIQEWQDVSAEGADRPALLAAWLEELVFLAEHRGLVPITVSDLRLDPTAVGGRVGGYRGRPPHLVKAVTYHRLMFERGDGGWRATLVLDV